MAQRPPIAARGGSRTLDEAVAALVAAHSIIRLVMPRREHGASTSVVME
jgi:hypothetical protein